jgi:hypothetical protein
MIGNSKERQFDILIKNTLCFSIAFLYLKKYNS